MLWKSVLVVLIVLGCSTSVHSQYYKHKKYLVGASLGYQYPLGDFGDQAKAGGALRISGQMFVNKKLIVGTELAYNSLGQDDFWRGSQSVNHDVKYQIGSALLKGSFLLEAWDKDFKPYISLAFGYYFYRFTDDFSSVSSGAIPQKQKVREGKAGLAPNVGFMYYLSDNWAFDMNVRYTYIPNFPDSVTATNERGDEYSYYLGFSSISLPEISIGLFYRF